MLKKSHNSFSIFIQFDFSIIHTGFVFAAGKSFKSGRMNYPVNVFVIPSKSGMRLGLTFGFNAKNKQVK